MTRARQGRGRADAQYYQVVARFQGGPNAGHTLEFNGEKYVPAVHPFGYLPGRQDQCDRQRRGARRHSVPRRGRGAGQERSRSLTRQLCISKKAHLILPTHRILDAAYEAAKGSSKIGTTGKGIGPTYTDKVSRNGMRVGDLLSPDFRAIYAAAKARHEAILRSLGYAYDIAPSSRRSGSTPWSTLPLPLHRQRVLRQRRLDGGQERAGRGAQGTLLDVDFGSIPSSLRRRPSAPEPARVWAWRPNRIGEVFGIFKAYCTRVGSGPFRPSSSTRRAPSCAASATSSAP